MLRMDQVYVVRHKILVEKLSTRQVARELHIGRNTINRYLADAEPGVRKPIERKSPVMDHVKPRIEQLLGDAPRWTGTRHYDLELRQLLAVQGPARRAVELCCSFRPCVVLPCQRSSESAQI
jgi:hypothetical protein